MAETVLQVEHVSKYFAERRTVVDVLRGHEQKYLKAVDDVSFSIEKGQNLGLVGESGCGKSTLAKCVLRLYKPTKGRIILDGTDITTLKGEALRLIRPKMQMVFQDPSSSLNPRMNVHDIIAEVLRVHHVVEEDQVDARVEELLALCGLQKEVATRFPGEFSGGQQQRVGIARALALHPSFLVADEPVSALDVSIQAQILNLLRNLEDKLGQTMLFISHDLAVIHHITQKVEVMYLGSIVEYGDTDEVFSHAAHPYTKVLMDASPKLDPRDRKRNYVIEGEPPSPINVPSGCKFHTRCPYCKDICKHEVPALREISGGHMCACHFPL